MRWGGAGVRWGDGLKALTTSDVIPRSCILSRTTKLSYKVRKTISKSNL